MGNRRQAWGISESGSNMIQWVSLLNPITNTRGAFGRSGLGLKAWSARELVCSTVNRNLQLAADGKARRKSLQ